MTRYMSLILTGLLSLAVVSPVYAVPNDDGLEQLQTKLGNEWMLVKNDLRRGIKTYAKQEDGKDFRSFKVEAIVDSTLEAAVRVMFDVDSYKKWYWQIDESYILKRVSDTEHYIYLKHRAPHGLPDRDVILHVQYDPQTKTKNTLTLKVQAVPDFIPEKPPLVRMLAEDMSVKYTPLPNNRVLVEAEGYVDPGGKVPTWVNNYIQRNAPYSILVGLVRMMSSETYRNSKEPVPFAVVNTP